jgi:hypothetical protein
MIVQVSAPWAIVSASERAVVPALLPALLPSLLPSPLVPGGEHVDVQGDVDVATWLWVARF